MNKNSSTGTKKNLADTLRKFEPEDDLDMTIQMPHFQEGHSLISRAGSKKLSVKHAKDQSVNAVNYFSNRNQLHSTVSDIFKDGSRPKYTKQLMANPSINMGNLNQSPMGFKNDSNIFNTVPDFGGPPMMRLRSFSKKESHINERQTSLLMLGNTLSNVAPIKAIPTNQNSVFKPFKQSTGEGNIIQDKFNRSNTLDSILSANMKKMMMDKKCCEQSHSPKFPISKSSTLQDGKKLNKRMAKAAEKEEESSFKTDSGFNSNSEEEQPEQENQKKRRGRKREKQDVYVQKALDKIQAIKEKLKTAKKDGMPVKER